MLVIYKLELNIQVGEVTIFFDSNYSLKFNNERMQNQNMAVLGAEPFGR